MSRRALRASIGTLLYQVRMSRGDARMHWLRNSHIVIHIEKLYNNKKASKDELIMGLEKMIEIAEGITIPRFRIENEIRINAARKVIRISALPLWKALYWKISKFINRVN